MRFRRAPETIETGWKSNQKSALSLDNTAGFSTSTSYAQLRCRLVIRILVPNVSYWQAFCEMKNIEVQKPYIGFYLK